MIERCFDLRRVKRLTDADLFISRKVFYLIEVKENKDVGVMAFVPTTALGLVVHVEINKTHRGKEAVKFYRDAFAWIFEHTEHDKIIGQIPIANRPACFMARHSGARFDGIEDGALRCYSLDKQTFMDTRNDL